MNSGTTVCQARLKRSTRCGVVGGLAIGFMATWARAGNLDSFYVSSDAALQAGAVVATSNTGGSIWYNPAGMSRSTGTRLDVNVSGYAVRFGEKVSFESSIPGAEQRRLTLMQIDVVPAAVTLTRRFGKVGVGIGVFVPAQTAVTLRTYLGTPNDAEGQSLEFGYDSTAQSRAYHAGPGIGWALTQDLSLGMSLLANYHTQSESTDVSAALSQSDEGDLVQSGWAQHHRLDSVGVGLELVLGTQWQLGRGYRMGLVVRTPSLRLGHAAEQIDTEIVATPDGKVEQEIIFDEQVALGTQILSPFRFHAGLSRTVGDFTASAEASVQLPLKNDPLSINDRATWNARLGVMSQLNPTWAIGGGLFTDRSPAPEPEKFLDTKVDYYGLTFALNWKTQYGVFSRGGEVIEEPEPMIFGTTLAFSYALGVGSIAGAVVGPSASGGIEIVPQPADVFAHEFLLHIATSIAE